LCKDSTTLPNRWEAWKARGRVLEEKCRRVKQWREKRVAPTNRQVIAGHGSVSQAGSTVEAGTCARWPPWCFITCAIDAEEFALSRRRTA
jgi:hypothetical protein